MIDQPNFQNKFIVQARNLGWPEDVVQQLQVELDESKLDVNVPSELEDTVFDLEYGKFQEPPRAAIRNFKGRVGKEAANAVIEKMATDKFKGSVFD